MTSNVLVFFSTSFKVLLNSMKIIPLFSFFLFKFYKNIHLSLFSNSKKYSHAHFFRFQKSFPCPFFFKISKNIHLLILFKFQKNTQVPNFSNSKKYLPAPLFKFQKIFTCPGSFASSLPLAASSA